MTRALVLTLAITSLVGCGDGGPGPSITFAPPGRSGADPFASSADRGVGTDRGGGNTSAVGGLTEGSTESAQAPAACSKTVPCSRGTCTSGTAGYCLEQCVAESCPSGYQCVTVERAALCVLPCAAAADCPAITGLVGSCVSLGTGQPKVCSWARQSSADSSTPS